MLKFLNGVNTSQYEGYNRYCIRPSQQLNIDVNSVLGCSHNMDASSYADSSELHSGSIFRAEDP
jgi:hypothetical protein